MIIRCKCIKIAIKLHQTWNFDENFDAFELKHFFAKIRRFEKRRKKFSLMKFDEVCPGTNFSSKCFLPLRQFYQNVCYFSLCLSSKTQTMGCFLNFWIFNFSNFNKNKNFFDGKVNMIKVCNRDYHVWIISKVGLWQWFRP